MLEKRVDTMKMKPSQGKRTRLPWHLVSAFYSFITVSNGFCAPSTQRVSYTFDFSRSTVACSCISEITDMTNGLSDDKRRLLSVLSRHAGTRLRIIPKLPSSLAEVYLGGRAICVDLLAIDPGSGKLTIRQNSDAPSQIIDFSQLTSIWSDSEAALLRFSHNSHQPRNVEDRLEELYFSHIGRGRSGSLTKKQLSSMELTLEDAAIVRKTLKAGENMARLLDSAFVAKSLGPNSPSVLCKDSKEGGRFKRFPSVLVAITDDASVILVNGGWLVLDRSTRSTTEARKFVARNGAIETAADRRIIRQLECLAMGELFNHEQDRQLDVGVQETLKGMGLTESPAAAKEALIRLGLWSGGADVQQKFKSSAQPWSREILNAANKYASFLQSRAADLCIDSRNILTRLPCVVIDNAGTSFRDDGIGLRPRQITGRPVINGMKWEILVHIADVSDIFCPFPSIALKNAGIDEQTCDVLDSLSILQEAARTRGYSRYDLPFGPLHLLPPVVLRELSLERSRRAVTLWAYIDECSGDVIDSGMERTVIPEPAVYTYGQVDCVLNGKIENQALVVISRLLGLWDQKRQEKRRRMGRFSAAGRSGHQLVDQALDLYSLEAFRMLRKHPVPWTPGAEVWRGGRVGTGVLRRYVDGQAQRQILSVICNYGGKPLSLDECKEIGSATNDARNAITNLRSFRSTERG